MGTAKLVDDLLGLLGSLAQGLDQLVHGAGRDQSSNNPPLLIQPHTDNLKRKYENYVSNLSISIFVFAQNPSKRKKDRNQFP